MKECSLKWQHSFWHMVQIPIWRIPKVEHLLIMRRPETPNLQRFWGRLLKINKIRRIEQARGIVEIEQGFLFMQAWFFLGFFLADMQYRLWSEETRRPFPQRRFTKDTDVVRVDPHWNQVWSPLTGFSIHSRAIHFNLISSHPRHSKVCDLFISSSSRTRPCLCGLSRLAWHPHQHWSGYFRRGTHLENGFPSTLWRTSQIKPNLVTSAFFWLLFSLTPTIIPSGNKQQFHVNNNSGNFPPMNEHSDGVLLEVIIEFLRCCWMNILNGEENNLISFLERKVIHPFPLPFLDPQAQPWKIYLSFRGCGDNTTSSCSNGRPCGCCSPPRTSWCQSFPPHSEEGNTFADCLCQRVTSILFPSSSLTHMF